MKSIAEVITFTSIVLVRAPYIISHVYKLAIIAGFLSAEFAKFSMGFFGSLKILKRRVTF
jgi:hypothetical protein